MSLHVVVGAGPVGSATATLLAANGEHVRVITRRGTGPRDPRIELVAADAVDPGHLRELSAGAVALYNCANPAYERWLTDWPPLCDSLLRAAEASGAVLVTMSNLYGYGPVDGPISESTPLAATAPKLRLRGDLWRTALAAHRAGRVRVTEARGGTYLGAGSASMLTEVVLPAVLAGRPVRVPAPLDVPHAHTYTGDAARLLVTLATDERAWGRAWHVPSPPAVTLRHLVVRAAEIAGAPTPRLSVLPYPVVRVGGLVNRRAREFIKVYYQYGRPFLMDSSLAQRTFGLTPTDQDRALRETVKGI
jgi:nucleoside-diphosphate-sugar epimerase